MPRSSTDALQALLRRALRCYGLRSPVDHGKYRLVNYWAPRLVPADPTPVVVRAPDGFRMSLALGEHVQQRAYYLGYHQRVLMRVFGERVRPATTVFDLGANFGQFALLAAQRVGPQGQVFAYEPSPLAYEALERNAALNGSLPIVCRQVAVGAVSGKATFYTSPASDQGTGSLARRAVERYHPNVGSVTVPVERLDDCLGRLSCPVSMIKMDVQGAELPALQGAERLLRQYRPALLVEVDEEVTAAFGYQAADLGAYLHDLGYQLYAVPARPRRRLLPLDWRSPAGPDILCIHKDSEY
jgi:FkbM family methyltransferase